MPGVEKRLQGTRQYVVNFRHVMFIALVMWSVCSPGVAQASSEPVIDTVAGDGTFGFTGDGGPAVNARLASPSAAVCDNAGNLYIADTYNGRIRKVDTNGIITTVAGNGTQGYSGDNVPATSASLSRPAGVSVDSTGNLYIADTLNHRIRKVNTNGVITTVAGTGQLGYSGDNGPATNAALSRPSGVFVDNNGNLFIADTDNNRIRKVNTNGVITTVAGDGTIAHSDDGIQATAASIPIPFQVFADSSGNIYIPDRFTHRIRKVAPSGVISTIAGTGSEAFSGDEGPAIQAQLASPYSVCVDSSDNVFIADSGNHRIRQIDVFGIIRTAAGTGTRGFSGDDGPATAAKIASPYGVSVDSAGNFYIADSGNNRIRMVELRLLANAGPDRDAIVDLPVQLDGTPGGGEGNYQFEWSIVEGPNLDSNQLSSTTAEDPVFTPTAPGDYVLQFSVSDGVLSPASDLITITAYMPVVADAGPNLITFIQNPLRLMAEPSGGDGTYVISWAIRSGPDFSLSQFSATNRSDPTFTPNKTGTYVLEITVNDEMQNPVSDTVTILSIPVSPLDAVIITDTLDDFDDLSNGIDIDPTDSRELVIRWNLDPAVVDLDDINDIQVWARINETGGYSYLGRTSSGTATFLEWSASNGNGIHPSFQAGPQFGTSYEFRVFVITQSGVPNFYGPFESKGPVQFSEDVPIPPTATPVSTSTPTPAQPTPVASNTPEPTSTPPPNATATGTPTFTPVVTPTPTNPNDPTATATERPSPTFTPPPDATATPTSLPPDATYTPTNPPQPTQTPTNTPSGPTSTPTPLVPSTRIVVDGSTVNGSISQSGQEQWFRFTPSTSGQYVIETHAAALNNIEDTVIFLFGPDQLGNQLTFDDDSGEGFFSKIIYSLQGGGTYYVAVLGFATMTGNFRIDVKTVQPEPTATAVPSNTPTPTNTQSPTPVPGDPDIRIEPLTISFTHGEAVPEVGRTIWQKQAVTVQPRDWGIYLQTGTIETKRMEALDVKLMAKAPAVTNKHHALIQFQNIPSEKERQALESQGIQLLRYVPNMAYWAVIESRAPGLNTLSAGDGVRWTMAAKGVERLSPSAAVLDFHPDSRLEDGRVVTHVVFFGDVSADEAAAELNSIGCELQSWYAPHVARVAVYPAALNTLASLDVVEWVEPAPAPNTTDNVTAAQRIHVTELRSIPYELNGKDVIVGVWDGGRVYPHQDFGASGRLQVIDSGASVSSHATHVAGTIAGSGAGNSLALGMAPLAQLRSYDWNSDSTEMRSGTQGGIRLSNHSYGEITGWYWNGSGWVDYGSTRFGAYTTSTQEWDDLVYDTGLLVFKSAGNDRNDGPDASRKDGPYDCIPPRGNAKNIITIGATDDSDSMTSFSSWGPTNDGRIKPDLVANGYTLTSTTPNNQYGSSSGTSMSSPSACGSGAMLFQYFKQETGEEPAPETLKALMIHGAQDIGNTGPDYSYGWGLINAKQTADLIKNGYWETGTVSNGETVPFTVSVPNGAGTFKVTVVWTDVAGSPASAKALVNDLDLSLQAPSGTVHYPWSLNADNPSALATRNGPNDVDNVEQTFVTNPEAGQWRIEVNGGTVPQGPVNFTLVTEFIQDTGATASFRIYNDGVGTLNVSSMALDQEANWMFLSPQAPFSIAPGQDVKVTVSANPDQAPIGQSSRRVLIESNDPDGSKSPYPNGVFIEVTNNSTPTPTPTITPTPSNTPTPTNTLTPTITPTPRPMVPDIEIDPLTIDFIYVPNSGNSEQQVDAVGPLAQANSTDNDPGFEEADELPDGRILVWTTFEPGTDLYALRQEIEARGDSIISLTPEGRLLLAVLPENLQQVASADGVQDIAPAVPRTDSIPEDDPLPDPALGVRPPTKDEVNFVQEAFTDIAAVDPNGLAVQRAALEGQEEIPATVDNSNSKYFPPIRSQGAQGSCTAWASAYYYNTYTQARDEDYDVSGGNNDYICSPGFLYPLVNGGQDSGGYTSYVVSRLSDVGCGSWSLKPYSSSDYSSWPTEETWIQALKNRTKDSYRIVASTDADIVAIKTHLANGNIAVTQAPVYTNWYRWYDNQGRGIQNGVLFSHSGESLVGYHAITIVGYDDTRTYNTGSQTKQGAFLIANSWGTYWGTYNSTGAGSRGFMWVAYDYFKLYFRYAFYNQDREDYRPALYAVTGLNHSQRERVAYSAGIGDPDSPDWTSQQALDQTTMKPSGGRSYSISDSQRVAIDLTDGVPALGNGHSIDLFIKCSLLSGSSGGTISSADFFHDLDGDGTYTQVSSEDPTLTFTSSNSGIATVNTKTVESFTISNRGAGVLSVSAIEPDQAAPWIVLEPQAPFDIPADSEQVVTVEIDWDQIELGQYSRQLLVESNDSAKSPYPGGVFININKNALPTPTPTSTFTPTATPTRTPIPTPTNTSVPTSTPRPTNTRIPTSTPRPTNTPQPTNTQVIIPTSTPRPTNTNTPVPTATPRPTNTPVPTATPRPTNTAVPSTFTPTPSLTPSQTPIPTATQTNTPVPPTATHTPSPTSTATATATATITPTPSPTPLLQIQHTYTFDPLSSSLNSLGFSLQPEDASVSIARIPADLSSPQATNGVGLRVSVPSGGLVTINGPEIDVRRTPVSLSLWYQVSNADFQVGLGFFAEVEGNEGAIAYAAHYAPELVDGFWTNIQTELGANYTKVTPFIMLLNTNSTEAGTAYIDNLIVVEGADTDPGSLIDPGEFHPNLWLTPEQAGSATIENGQLILDKSEGKLGSQFVAYFGQDNYPNRVTAELDLVREFGELGSVTLWIGTGPSGVQKDIPLWALPQGEERTLKLSGIVNEAAGPMHVVIMISGQDHERVIVKEVRVYEDS